MARPNTRLKCHSRKRSASGILLNAGKYGQTTKKDSGQAGMTPIIRNIFFNFFTNELKFLHQEP
jgi:hypothetical protein